MRTLTGCRWLHAGSKYSMSVRDSDVRERREWSGGSCLLGAHQQRDTVSLPGAGDEEAASLHDRQTTGQVVATGSHSPLRPWRPARGIRQGTCCNHYRYRTIRVIKRARSASLYHSRQYGIVVKPHLACLGYTVVCFMTRNCTRKLWKRQQCKLSVV